MTTVEIEYFNGETRKLLVPMRWSELLSDLTNARRVVIDHGRGGGEVYWREGEAWYGVREGVSGTTFVADRHLANIIRDALGVTVVLVTKLQRRRTTTVRVWIYQKDLLGSVQVKSSHKGLTVDVSVTTRGRLHSHLFAGLVSELINHLDTERDELQDFIYAWCGW